MAGFQLTGLASGFDWKSLVDQLIAVSRAPQDRLRAEKGGNIQKSTAIDEVRTLMEDLKSSLQGFKSSGVFAQRSTSFASSTSTWSAEAAVGTAVGEHTFSVSKLATAARLEGIGDIGKSIANSSDVSGVVLGAMNLNQSVTAGDFTVNGTKITVATTDTLQEVFDRVSAATGVVGTYDATLDKVSFAGASNITLGSSSDTSNFLQTLKLFQNGGTTVSSASSLGTLKVGGSIASAGLRTAITGVDGAGAGTFKLNGVEIAYNLNTDSIQNVITRINSSAAGVTASYDPSGDRLVLKNKSTGNMGIFLEEGAGGFLAALGVNNGSATTVAGVNAEFSVDGGGTIISQSNSFDESAHGITGLRVTAKTVGVESVTVAPDSKNARTKVDEFVTKFNALEASIAKNTKTSNSGTKVTTSVLSGIPEIGELARGLRGIAFSAGTGQTGTVKRLADLGIDFKGTESILSVKNSATLERALSENPSEVETFFSTTTSGLAQRLETYINAQTGKGGTLTVQTDSLTRRSADLDKQMATLERRLTLQRSQLENSFIEMERIQSTFQKQGQLLSSFATN